MKTVTRQKFIASSLLLQVMFLFCSCAAPQYDSTADTKISTLQSNIHGQIDSWISGSKPGTYEKNVAFYDGVDTDLKSLELRMEATPDPSTANLSVIFSNLNTQISTLRTTHKGSVTLSEFFLRPTQQQLDAQFAALLTYELSLKTTGSGTTQSTATTQNPSKPAQ